MTIHYVPADNNQHRHDHHDNRLDYGSDDDHHDAIDDQFYFHKHDQWNCFAKPDRASLDQSIFDIDAGGDPECRHVRRADEDDE